VNFGVELKTPPSILYFDNEFSTFGLRRRRKLIIKAHPKAGVPLII